MPSGAEEAAQAARKAKGLPPTQTPEQFYGGIIAKLIIKEINMGFIGNIATWFSTKYTKSWSAFLGAIIGSIVSFALGWIATKVPGLATCAADAAGQQACTISVFGHAYSQAEITAALLTIVMTWFSTHGVASAPANKPS